MLGYRGGSLVPEDIMEEYINRVQEMKDMEFRKAIESDIESIMKIIKQAQNYLREQGIDQWQNNYPNKWAIKKIQTIIIPMYY